MTDVTFGGQWPRGYPLIEQNGKLIVGSVRDDSPFADATAVGYTTLTHAVNSNFDATTIDLANTKASGFKWYRSDFFGHSLANLHVTVDAQDGYVSCYDPYYNQCLSTAAQNGAGAFVGTAFGGGAYFEATIRFDPGQVVIADGWPSVWTMPIEHLIGVGNDWPGQAAGYKHFIEADMFEFNYYDVSGVRNKTQGWTHSLHDWYGIYGTPTAGQFSVVDNVNAPTLYPTTWLDWTNWNKIGMLWVPATASQNGYFSWYVNRVQTATRAYSQYTNQTPPPTTGTSWTFGIADLQHLVPIIGAGSKAPIQCRSFNVWQANTAGNLVY